MRNGKIAKLSHPIRDELNLRMENGEDGAKLLEWLNALPQVQTALKAGFAGTAISKQNLSEWRRGGFREWQMQQDLISHACQLAECGREMGEVVDPPLLAGDLVAVLAARYAALLNTWDGEAELKFEEKLRLLRGLAQDIALIQRTIQRATQQENEFERQLEDSHQRALDKVKEKTLAPIWAMLQSQSLAGALGGGAASKKMAEFMAAVENDLPLPTDFQKVQPGQTQSNPVKPQKEV